MVTKELTFMARLNNRSRKSLINYPKVISAKVFMIRSLCGTTYYNGLELLEGFNKLRKQNTVNYIGYRSKNSSNFVNKIRGLEKLDKLTITN